MKQPLFENGVVKLFYALKSVIIDILKVVYQQFWFALILSVLFMFIWKNYSSVKAAIKQWYTWFRTEYSFRRMFLLVFYTIMMLLRTVLNRNIWMDPLSKVFEDLWILQVDSGTGARVLSTECLENLILFIPFIVLLFWNYREKILGEVKLGKVFWQSAKISFLFSLTIETLQLFLRLGTWQFSDLIYNTLGGICGGLIYWCCYRAGRSFY